MKTKWCYKCRKDVPVTDFTTSTTSKDKLHSYCKPCKRQYEKTFYENQLEARPDMCQRVEFLRKFYAITDAMILKKAKRKDIHAVSAARADRVLGKIDANHFYEIAHNQ